MDNYKETKNFIHNELKITREDVQEIVRATVREEISKLMNDKSLLNSLVEKEIKKGVNKDYLKRAVQEETSKMVQNKLEINLKDDFKDNEKLRPLNGQIKVTYSIKEHPEYGLKTGYYNTYEEFGEWLTRQFDKINIDDVTDK